jgi:ATP-dependent Clp protease ATP-binding subunit ClpA
MTVEELLLFLLSDKDVATAVISLNGDVARLKSELIQFISETSEVLPPTDKRDTQPTVGFQRALQRAVYHVQSSGRSEVTPLRTLIAVYGEKDSHAVKLLHDQAITRLDIVNYVQHNIHKDPPRQFLRFGGHPELSLQESTPCPSQAPAPPINTPRNSRLRPSV